MANSTADEDKALRREIDALRSERDALRRRLAAAERSAVIEEAVEHASDAIVIYDADGRLVACNSSFRRLYGYSAEEARPGAHFAELGRLDVARGCVVVGDELGGGEAYLQRKAEYRRRLEGSFIVQLKDGRWIKTTDRPMRRGGFVSVQVDVTEMKRAEQALKAAKEEAEQAARIKSEFLANMSHDLRTPLNAILGFSEMVLSGIGGPIGNEKHRDYVQSIHKSGDLLLSIVNDILDTAKLDSNAYQPSPDWFELAACARDTVRIFEPMAAEKRLSLAVDVDPGAPAEVYTDQRGLIQILNNLLSNACRHSPPGGAVTVAWRRTDRGRLRLTVTDEGPGLPDSLLAKIGEPFLTDGAPETPRDQRGSGLGLYICTRLAQALGGALRVRNRPDGGAEVAIDWPAAALGGRDAPDSAAS